MKTEYTKAQRAALAQLYQEQKAEKLRLDAEAEDLAEDIYRRWKSGEIKGEAAAQECGWPMSSFRYRAAVYERQNAGSEEIARGIRMGRPSRPYPENWEDIYRRWKNGEISGGAAAQECGWSSDAFHYRARTYEQQNGGPA